MENPIKLAIGVVAALVLLIFSFSIWERIDAGHVGVKVNLYGDGKGVDDVTEVTGLVFYNPFTTKIIEFPTFVQHKEYKNNGEDNPDESFVVNSKDGSEFHVSPLLNYSVKREKAPYIFNKYRVTLDEIESGFLKTAVYDAFRLVANSYTADELISNREQFEVKVRKVLESHLLPEGFILAQFTSNLVYPETFKKAIEAKNNAVQNSLMAENKVRQAEAEAKTKVVQAEGEAKSLITIARAEAEANKLRQSTLSQELIDQQWIQAWKAGGSKVPTYISGSGGDKFILNMK